MNQLSIFSSICIFALLHTFTITLVDATGLSGCGDNVNTKTLLMEGQNELIMNEYAEDCIELILIDKKSGIDHQRMVLANDYNSFHKEVPTSSNTIHSGSHFMDIISVSIESDKSYNIYFKEDDVILNIKLNTKIANYDLIIPLKVMPQSIDHKSNQILDVVDEGILETNKKLQQQLQAAHDKINELMERIASLESNTCSSNSLKIDESTSWNIWTYIWRFIRYFVLIGSCCLYLLVWICAIRQGKEATEQVFYLFCWGGMASLIIIPLIIFIIAFDN